MSSGSTCARRRSKSGGNDNRCPSAAAYARRTQAGTPADHLDRYGALADQGVDTVFVALGDLDGPEDVERIAPLTR